MIQTERESELQGEIERGAESKTETTNYIQIWRLEI